MTARNRLVSFSEFPHVSRIQTRWGDNDIYGHVNNVVYYSYFDTAINAFLISDGGLDIAKAEVRNIVAIWILLPTTSFELLYFRLSAYVLRVNAIFSSPQCFRMSLKPG